MRQTITATRASTAEPSRTVPSFRRAMAELWHSLSKDLAGTYRPERHYMRGPGPKWHAKHDGRAAGRAELGLSGNLSAA
jgi:hypothetical protein